MTTLTCPKCRFRVYVGECGTEYQGGSLVPSYKITCSGQTSWKPHAPTEMTMLKEKCSNCRKGWTCKIHKPQVVHTLRWSMF